MPLQIVVISRGAAHLIWQNHIVVVMWNSIESIYLTVGSRISLFYYRQQYSGKFLITLN